MVSANQPAEKLLALLEEKKLTLAVAENATGGALAQALEDGNAVFRLGIVAGDHAGRPVLMAAP